MSYFIWAAMTYRVSPATNPNTRLRFSYSVKSVSTCVTPVLTSAMTLSVALLITSSPTYSKMRGFRSSSSWRKYDARSVGPVYNTIWFSAEGLFLLYSMLFRRLFNFLTAALLGVLSTVLLDGGFGGIPTIACGDSDAGGSAKFVWSLAYGCAPFSLSACIAGLTLSAWAARAASPVTLTPVIGEASPSSGVCPLNRASFCWDLLTDVCSSCSDSGSIC